MSAIEWTKSTINQDNKEEINWKKEEKNNKNVLGDFVFHFLERLTQIADLFHLD